MYLREIYKYEGVQSIILFMIHGKQNKSLLRFHLFNLYRNVTLYKNP